MALGTGPAQSGKPALTAVSLTEFVKHLPVGKRVGGEVYIHRDALAKHDPTLLRLVPDDAADGGDMFRWNVCKLSPRRRRLSLLLYPRFRELQNPLPKKATDPFLRKPAVRK